MNEYLEEIRRVYDIDEKSMEEFKMNMDKILEDIEASVKTKTKEERTSEMVSALLHCLDYWDNPNPSRVSLETKLDLLFLSDWSSIMNGVSITPCGLTDEEKEYIIDKYDNIYNVFKRIYDVTTADINRCYCEHTIRTVPLYSGGTSICSCCGINLIDIYYNNGTNHMIEGGLPVIKKILLSDEEVPKLNYWEAVKFLKFLICAPEFKKFCEIPYWEHIYYDSPNDEYNNYFKEQESITQYHSNNYDKLKW